MAKKRAPRKAAAEETQPVSRASDPESTTFAPLDAPSGTRLSDKERAEQTQFKPLTTDDEK